MLSRQYNGIICRPSDRHGLPGREILTAVGYLHIHGKLLAVRELYDELAEIAFVNLFVHFPLEGVVQFTSIRAKADLLLVELRTKRSPRRRDYAVP